MDTRTAIVARAFHPQTTQGPAHLVLDDDPQLLAMSDRLHDENQLVLCQVHTHPGRAFHSSADDRGAYTDEIGFLSMVVGQFAEKGLAEAEIYRRDVGGWVHEGAALGSCLIAIFDDRLRYEGGEWHAQP